MKGTPAVYRGRIVDKTNFRAFIYGTQGERKLVNSWDEYEAAMQSGLWFATRKENEIKAPLESEVKPLIMPTVEPKPKAKSKAKRKLDDMVFEVKDGE